MRLVKWWTNVRKKEDPNFRFRSFLAEMICAHLADTGAPMSPYPEALERFFGFLSKDQLSQRISFTDYYAASELPSASTGVIEVFDPVNPENNAASDYAEGDRQRLVKAATASLEALAFANYATSRTQALECWRRVLGPGFGR